MTAGATTQDAALAYRIGRPVLAPLFVCARRGEATLEECPSFQLLSDAAIHSLMVPQSYYISGILLRGMPNSLQKSNRVVLWRPDE